jgi:drug/metabolite transporter (DMT)-like permease
VSPGSRKLVAVTSSGSVPASSGPTRISGGAARGLAAAALFGASTPVAKLLVPGTGPLLLAGLLYVGAGMGLLVAGGLRRTGTEAPIQRVDLPVLALVVVAGGILGPVLLVLGLARLSGASAALLLNLEAPFTISLAVVMLGEHLARREALGAAVVIFGAGALTWAPGALEASPAGAACVALACAAWALDNNLSQRLSIRDPVAVARAKTLAAGAFNVALGLAVGERLPSPAHVAAALLTGALGYGLSIVLHLLAVRALGAARQAAYFATAPFIGAVVAVPLLHDRLPPSHVAAGALMALGIALIVGTRHAHAHLHEAEQHEHAHVHDEHHAHVHDGEVSEPHSHVHGHASLFHDHPHLPDAHHRHGH